MNLPGPGPGKKCESRPFPGPGPGSRSSTEVNITTLVLRALMVRSLVLHQFMMVFRVFWVRSQITSRSLPSARETEKVVRCISITNTAYFYY